MSLGTAIDIDSAESALWFFLQVSIMNKSETAVNILIFLDGASIILLHSLEKEDIESLSSLSCSVSVCWF